MVNNLQDSVLKTIHHELGETLKKMEVRLADAFEFEETVLPEEVSNELKSVRDSLLILGEPSAAELTGKILSLSATRLEQAQNGESDFSEIADAFLVLSEYIASDDHTENEALLQSALAKFDGSMVRVEYDADALKTLGAAKKQLEKIRNAPNETKSWQIFYKVSEVLKKLSQTKEAYDIWWMIQSISGQQVQGSNPLSADKSLELIEGAQKFISSLEKNGESSDTYSSVDSFVQNLERTFRLSKLERNNYNPPSISVTSSADNFLFPVSKKTIEDVAFLVKREVSVIKNAFEQSMKISKFEGKEDEIVTSISLVSATFELFGLPDVVKICTQMQEKLKTLDFETGKHIKDFAENLVSVEDSLWALSYVEKGFDVANYTQNIGLHTTNLTSAEHFGSFFKGRRNDAIANKLDVTSDGFMNSAESIHEMYAAQVMLGNLTLAGRLENAEKTDLFLANAPDTIKDKRAYNLYISQLVTLEVIFEDLQNGSGMSDRSSSVLDRTQEQLRKTVSYSDSKLAEPHYGQRENSEFATEELEDLAHSLEEEIDIEVDDEGVTAAPAEATEDATAAAEEGQGASEPSNYEDFATAYGLDVGESSDIDVTNTADLDDDMLEIFLEEVREIEINMRETLNALEENPHNEEEIANIRRYFHTIKGSGRMVGLNAFGEFGWEHEELLNKVISNEIEPNKTVVKTLGVAHKLMSKILNSEPFFEDAAALLKAAATAKAMREYMLDNGEPEYTEPTSSTAQPDTLAMPEESDSETLEEGAPTDETTGGAVAASAAKKIIESEDLKRELAEEVRQQLSSGLAAASAGNVESLVSNAEPDALKALSEHPALKESMKESITSQLANDDALKKELTQQLKEEIKQEMLKDSADQVSLSKKGLDDAFQASADTSDASLSSDLTTEQSSASENVTPSAGVSSQTVSKLKALANIASILSEDPKVTQADMEAAVNSLSTIDEPFADEKKQALLDEAKALGDAVGDVGNVQAELGEIATGLAGALSALSNANSSEADIEKELDALKGMRQFASEVRENVEVENMVSETAGIQPERASLDASDRVKEGVGKFATPILLDFYESTFDDVQESQDNYDAWENTDFGDFNHLANLQENIRSIRDEAVRTDISEAEALTRQVSDVLAHLQNDELVPTKDSMPPIKDAVSEIKKMHDRLPQGEDATIDANVLEGLQNIKAKINIVGADIVADGQTAGGDALSMSAKMLDNQQVGPSDIDVETGAMPLSFGSRHLEDYYHELVEPLQNTRQSYQDWATSEYSDPASFSNLSQGFDSISELSKKRDAKEIEQVTQTVSNVLSQIANEDLLVDEQSAQPISYSLQAIEQMHAQLPLGGDATLGEHQVNSLAEQLTSSVPQRTEGAMSGASVSDANTFDFASDNLASFHQALGTPLKDTRQSFDDWKSSEYADADLLSKISDGFGSISEVSKQSNASDAALVADTVSDVLGQIADEDLIANDATVAPISSSLNALENMYSGLPSGGSSSLGAQTQSLTQQLASVANSASASAFNEASGNAPTGAMPAGPSVSAASSDVTTSNAQFISQPIADYHQALDSPLKDTRENFDNWAASDYIDTDLLSKLSQGFDSISEVSQKNNAPDAMQVASTVSSVLEQMADEDVVINNTNAAPISDSLEALESMHSALPSGGSVGLQGQVMSLTQQLHDVAPNSEELAAQASLAAASMFSGEATSVTTAGAAMPPASMSPTAQPAPASSFSSDLPSGTTSFISPQAMAFYNDVSQEMADVQSNFSDWQESDFTDKASLSSLKDNVAEVSSASERAGMNRTAELSNLLGDSLGSILADDIQADLDTVKPIQSAIEDLQDMHASLPSGGGDLLPTMMSEYAPALSQMSGESSGASVPISPVTNIATQVSDVAPTDEPISPALAPHAALTFSNAQLREYFEHTKSDVDGVRAEFGNWESSSYSSSVALNNLRDHVESVKEASQKARLDEATELSASFAGALSKIAEHGIEVDEDTVQPIKDAVNAVGAMHDSLPEGGDGSIPAEFSGSIAGVQQFVTQISAEQLSQLNPSLASGSGPILDETQDVAAFEKSVRRNGYDDTLKQLSGQVFSYNTEVKRSGRTHEEIIDSIYDLEAKLDEKNVEPYLWEVLSALEGAITSMKEHGRVPTGRTQGIIERILHRFKAPETISQDDATQMINDLMWIRADLDEMTVEMVSDGLDEFNDFASSKLESLDSELAKLKDAKSSEEASVSVENLTKALEEVNSEAQKAGYKDGEALTNLINQVLEQGAKSSGSQGFDQNMMHSVEQGLSSLKGAVENIEQDGQGIIDSEVLEELEAVAEEKELENSEVKFNDASQLDETILEIFIDEAKNILDRSGQSIEEWIGNSHSNEPIHSLQRDMHTLKGSARMAELTVFGDLTHEMENLLDSIDNGDIKGVRDAGGLLRRGQAISENMVILAEQGAIVKEDVKYLDDLDAFLSEQTGRPRTRAVEEPEVDSHDGINDAISEENDTNRDNLAELNVSHSMSDFGEMFSDEEDKNIVTPSQQSTSQVATSAHHNDTATLDETILDIFTDEAKEILAQSGPKVESWLANPDDTEHVPDLRRDMHTLKGGARMAELTVMGDMAQSMETMLDDIIDGKLKGRSRAASILLDAQEQFVDMIKITEERGIINENVELQERYNKLSSSEAEPAPVIANTSANIPSPTQSEDKSPVASDTSDAVAPTSQPEATTSSTPAKTNDTSKLDPEILDLFTEEAHSILEKCRKNIEAWSKDSKNYSAVQGLQRSMHTLKGGARMAELTVFGDASHEVENLLDMIADGKMKQKAESAKILQDAQVLFEDMVDTAEKRGVVVEDKRFMSRLKALTGSDKAEALSSAELFASAPTKPAETESTKPASQEAKNDVPKASPKVEEPKTPPKPKADKQEKDTKAKTDNKDNKTKRKYTVRVSGDTLERLNTLVGEAVISRSRIERNIVDHGFQLSELGRTVERISEQLRRLDTETEAQILFRRESILDDDDQFDPLELDRFSEIQQLSRSLSESVNDLSNIRQTLSGHVDDTRQLLSQERYIHQEVQELLLSTSMVRFDSILPRVERIIYQVSEELGKEVELQMFGGQIEIERNMIEDLLPGFEHSIRNSLAHGIEKPEDRERLGKPRAGLLRIGVKRDGAEVIFVITDDGKGADYEKIRAKARKMGILDEERVNDKKYLADLMFGQGFSTAETTTQVAGRGIGMDVLRDVVNARKGKIDIETETGKGLATSIRLPFSMSITDALLVKAGRYSYAVPSVSIEGSSKMPAEQYERINVGEDVFHQYGQYHYRVMSLTKYFDPTAHPDYSHYGVPLLLVRIGSERIALEVEQIISRQEITIKAVNSQLNSIPGIIGASILDTGDPIAVLEATTVARSLWELRRTGTDVADVVTDVEPEVSQNVKILHVDDSITMRKITSKMLSKYDVEAVSAKDGLDAIDIIQEWIPDLILLDIEMPRMDGFEFATHVRNRSELDHVPIIMVTSRTGEKHRERAMEIGANGYMGKPYREDILIEEIEQLLNRKIGTA